MNSKTFLVPFIAVIAVMLVGFASADLVNQSTIFGVFDCSGIATTFNDIPLIEGMTTPIASMTGDTASVRVTFTALNDASNVKIKVWMDGYRDDVSASTSRLDLVAGTVYTKTLSLKLPSDIVDSVTEDYTLHVSISNAEGYDETSYTIRMQRDSYSFNVLSVDYPLQVSAGDTIPVAVVVENNGFHDLDNGYVVASISSLGVSSRGFFGDLVALENCSDDCNNQDSIQKVVYLKIPENANAGVYQLDIKVYNKETTTTLSKIINVGQSASTTVLAAVKNQDIKAGETKTYDLIIVNSANTVKVFTIQTVSGSTLTVSAPAVTTVAPQSSTTVPLTVTAADDAATGSYSFSVTVDGKQTTLGANVVSSGVSSSVIALTIVLVVIFVILLVVLIVLLTRKEKPAEEVETSYY